MKFVVTDDPRLPTCRIIRVREKSPYDPSGACCFRRLDEWRRERAASIWAWALGHHLNAIERAQHMRIMAWLGLFGCVVLPVLGFFWRVLFRGWSNGVLSS